MRCELRRPGPVRIDGFIADLDRRLRDEVHLRRGRHLVPQTLGRLFRALRAASKPVFQSGAMVLTALAVIIAVGARPASVSSPPEPASSLEAPDVSNYSRTQPVDLTERLPAEEFLAIRVPDNRDTPKLSLE